MTAGATPVVARSVLVIGGLAAATVAGLVLAVAIGPVPVPLDDTVAVLFGGTPDDPRSSVLIGTVRVPRALTAAVAGAALGWPACSCRPCSATRWPTRSCSGSVPVRASGWH